MQQKRIPANTGEPNDCTLATDLPSELLLGSLPPLKESLLCGHGFFLRGLPLRFGAIPVGKHLLDDVCAHESYSM